MTTTEKSLEEFSAQTLAKAHSLVGAWPIHVGFIPVTYQNKLGEESGMSFILNNNSLTECEKWLW